MQKLSIMWCQSIIKSVYYAKFSFDMLCTTQSGLQQRDFEVTRLNTYDTQPVQHVDAHHLQTACQAAVITFASPSAVKWVLRTSGRLRTSCILSVTLQCSRYNQFTCTAHCTNTTCRAVHIKRVCFHSFCCIRVLLEIGHHSAPQSQQNPAGALSVKNTVIARISSASSAAFIT